MKKLFLIIIILVSPIIAAQSQDFKYEIGAAAGVGFYMGDANPSKIFRKPGAAFGAVFRRNLNYRWAIKCDLATAGIKGDTRGLPGVFPGGAYYVFDRQLIDIGAQAEFNFFHYNTPQKIQYLKTVLTDGRLMVFRVQISLQYKNSRNLVNVFLAVFPSYVALN